MSDYKERIDAVLSKVGNKDNNYDYTSAYKDRIDAVLKRIEDEPNAKASNEEDGYMHTINMVRGLASHLKQNANPKEDDIPHLSEDTHMARDTQRRMLRVAPDDERGKELRNKVDTWNAEAVPQAIERLSIGEARVNPRIRPESPRVQRDYDVQNGRGERMATEIAREQKARETSLENLYDYSNAQAKEITRKYANDTNPEMSESERSELERYLTKQIYTTAFENNIDESGRYWATAYELSTGKNYKEFEKAETTKARDRQKEIAKELEAILAELEQKKEESHNNAGQSRGFFSSVENDYKTPYGTEYEIAEDALDHVNDLLTGTLVSAIKAEYNFTSMASFGRGRTYENEAINESLGKLYSGESLNEYDEYVIKIKQLEAEADMLQDFRSQHGDVVHDKWLWGLVNANELGKGIGTTLEKVPEFAAAMYGTSGLGSFQTLSVKAALKAGQKDLVQYGINTIGKNYALAKARGFAAAPFMPSTYGEYFKSLNSGYSFDENGGIHYKPVDKTQAYLGAVISNANEISSEYIGVGFSEALGWGARSVGNMVANSKGGGAIVNGVRKVTPNLTPQAKTAMLTFGVQADPVAETLGEAWGDIMTTFEGGLIGKEVDLGEYFTMDYWTTLSGVSILYGGTMAAMGAVKSYRDVNKAVKERDGILGEVINRNLYNTLVAISTSDDVVLASSALADFDWKGNYDNAQDMKAEMERARAYVVADLNVKVMEGVVSETSRLESFRGTIEGVRNIVYQNKAGKYSDIIREAEMDGKKVYIINGYEANTNQYIVVDATTGEKASVDKSKVKPTRELDVDTYIVESYKNEFSLETEKQRIADVKAKALQLDNPTEKDVARIASTLGIALPKVGNTVMLANGNMGAVTEVLSPTEYAVQDPSGATYKVHFTDILSTDKLTATAQGAMARGEVAAPIASAPQTETTPDTISPDENGITIGAEVTEDGRVGKVRARTQDGKYAVAFEAENGNYEDTEMEFFTGEELASLMGIAPAPTAETPEVAETAPTEMATTEDGSVDIEQMSAEDAAKVLVQRAGTIEEAKAQVKQVIETVAEERKKTAKAEKKASLNDIGKKSAELQALDARLEFYGEVLAALEGMLAEQQKQTMTEAQNVAEEAGVAPEATDAPDKTTEENKPVEQPTSGLIRNGAEMKFTDNVIKMVDFVAKRLGITVEFVNGLKNEAGQPINGDITGKRVRISTSGTKGVKFIMGHEFFHRMKDLVDEQTYADFVNSIKEYAGEKAWKVTMAHQRNVYRNHNARVVKEVMAKMSIDDVAKIAARLNVNIEGLSLENAKDAVIDGAVMGKEKGIAEVNAIFPKMLSYDDALMVEECAADVAGALVTNTKTFAKYVEDNSSNIPLVRGLRKAIRAMRDFFDSFGYTDQQRKLNALEQSLAGALKEAVAKEAKGIPSPVSSPSTTASNVTPQGVEPAQTENVPEEYADLGKSETAPIYNDGIVDTEAYTDALELARHLNEEWAGDREGAIGRLEFKLNAVEIAAHNARVYAKGEDVSAEDRAKYQQEAAEYDRQAKVYEEALAYLKKPAQPKFSLIGEVGAEALDRAEEATTRLDNLNVAREMEAQGKDALAIKQATGWERGKDGLWRYEVADYVNMFDFTGNVDYMRRHPEYRRYKELLRKRNVGMMFFKKGLTKEEQKEFDDLAIVYGNGVQPHNSHKLKDYLDSEELFAAYPQLRDINVEMKKELEDGYYGRYIPSRNTIELATRTHEHMARTLFHEVQHAIQHIEGFANGGNTEIADPRKVRERKEAMEGLQRKIDMHERTLERFEAELSELNDSMEKWWQSHPEAMSREDFDSEMQALSEVYDAQLKKAEREQNKLRETQKEYKKLVESSATLGYEGYERLAGEVEARATARRVGMSEEERRNTLQLNDEDIARKDQIILRNGLFENYADANPRFHLPDPDPNDVFYDEIPIFDEQGNEVDITTLTSEEAKEILDGKVRQMLEAEYDHAVVSIRKEAEEARQAVKEVYRAEKEKRRKGAKAARTNAARIDEIFGDTPFESLPYEVQALILIATGEAKIYWGDRGNKRGLASELGLTGSTGDRHAYRNIWGGAKKSFNEVVHDWWESIGGQERGIDDQDLRNALISALQSVQSSRDAMQEIINKYDDLAEDRDNTLAEIDRNEEKELYEAKSAYEQHLANFELSEGEERIAYRDRAAQFFGNQSLSRVDDILEDLTNELERSKRKIERLKAEKKDVYTPLAESIQKAKDTVLRALERLRMFAGMEEVDLNDVARLINLVKASRSQRQIENLGAQTTALVQRVSIKKAKTNLMRLLSLKLSNTDIIHKMLKESDTWTKEEREAILKHLWKVSRNGLRVSKAVHRDTKEIFDELKRLVDEFRKEKLKGLDNEQKAKIIETKLAEVEKELHPEVVYDSEGNVQDNADLPTDFNAENKHLAKFFFKSYLDMLAKEMEYHNAAAELHEKIDNKDKTDGANTAMVVARENYLNALNQFNSSLESLILEGKDKLRDWNAQKEHHEIEIRSMGIRAIGGKKASGQGKASSKMARARARINTTVNAPYWTFETVLEKIDHNSPYKKGKLYTYFMDMWADANDDLINRYASHMEEIAEVMRKCFPDDAKNILRMKRNPYALYQYIMRKAESTPIGTLTYKEMGEDGQMRDAQMVLNVANAMYVIAMWRQPRYQEAMQEKHGITQGDIDALMANIASLNAGFLDFMDWVNDTFLPSTRLEYDVVYRKMNGGSMPKEINYFPARVAGHKEVDLANIDNGALPTTPSALKDRTSAHIMPQLGMDYFKVLESHIQDMDNWAAYAELTADLNVLLSSDEFRRRCNDYMGGLGGDGGGKGSLYDLFKQTSLIATGMYRGDAGMEALLGQLQKAWATSNIAFRGWTAVKQISSITTGMFDNWAFYKHAGIAATGIGIYHEIKNAMEISPSLRYRWKSGAAGMEALARETQREDGYTVQRGAYEKGKDFIGDAIKTLVRAGMTPNAAVDLLSCSIIVNSVYETEIARLTGGKREATEEEKRAAVRKAERAFNTTQQSSEGAYLAPVQANPAYGVLTTYMNASFALHRKRMGGIKELWKLATSKKYRRYLKDEFGVDAAKISAKDAFKDILSGVAGELSFAMMGWGLMKVMTVINGWLNEDDDDEDVAAAKQEFFDSWWQSLLNGYLGGSVVSSWINGFDTSLTPAYDEFAKDVYRLTDDKGSVLWELGTMFTKYGIGIDLESLYKSAAAIENMYEDDERAGAVLMFLNAPDRYVKAFVGDRREGETLDEYTTRVGRTYALLEEIKFDEKGKPVGGGVYENFVPKSRYNGLDKVFEEEYREAMLKKYGGDKGYADYTMADLKHKQICGLLDWNPNATPSEEKVQTDMQDELEYYQKRVAKAIRKRKDWVGDDEGYYDLLMDEQEAKNDLINNYYEYIKQAGLGTY